MKFETTIQQLCISALATSMLALSACTITDITSSTSSTLDTVTPDVSLNRFVDTRIASIQQEAADGKGENLDALAVLMGQPDKAQFGSWMQVNYESLFNNLQQPTELISRIEAEQLAAQTRL